MAARKYLIDTCVIIEYLRGDRKCGAFLRVDNELYVAAITKKELFHPRGMTRKEQSFIEDFLNGVSILYPDIKTHFYYAMLQPLFNKYNLGKEYADRLIAATALAKKLPLATLNRKHFSFIKGLKLVDLGSQ